MSVERFEIRLGEPGYPALLATVDDPPKTLYVMGDPRRLVPGLAVIGARRATPYGIRAARMFSGWAASAGYTIVSGAARGCDHAAGDAALEARGATVAILGCGADVDYPRSSAGLLARLRAGAGAVVSELPWGSPPVRWAFPRRNRIIAGMSAAVLVVEAGLPSGTFNTADHALDAGRGVLVVPGSIFAAESRGANRLLRQGATPVTETSELAQEIEAWLGPPRVEHEASPGSQVVSDMIVAALRADPARPDDLARDLALDIVSVARRLGALEAAGVCRRHVDGRYHVVVMGGDGTI